MGRRSESQTSDDRTRVRSKGSFVSARVVPTRVPPRITARVRVSTKPLSTQPIGYHTIVKRRCPRSPSLPPPSDAWIYLLLELPTLFRPAFNDGVVYAHVVKAECPKLHEAMRWATPPSDLLCGDCIEALLAVGGNGEENSPLVFAGITIKDGADFFKDMSYKMWRVHRVIKWHINTVGPCLTLKDRLRQPMHERRCARCILPNPHDVTMRCALCGKWGCGFVIFLSPEGLLRCRHCEPLELLEF